MDDAATRAVEEAASRAEALGRAFLVARIAGFRPHAAGGVWLKGPAGAVRAAWLEAFAASLGAGRSPAPIGRAPADVDIGQLVGGLDLSATLAAGKPVATRGLLPRCDGGALIIAMAERLQPGAAGVIAAAMDRGAVVAEREGLSVSSPALFGVVALDEGVACEEPPPAVLTERLGYIVDLNPFSHRDLEALEPQGPLTAPAAMDAPAVEAHIVAALVGAADALGVAGVRAPLMALACARASAQMAGRDAVTEADASLAARLVLAPRATRLPAAMEEAEEQQAEADADDATAPEPTDAPPESDPNLANGPIEALRDQVIEAALASLPPGLLAQLSAAASRERGRVQGKSGDSQSSALRGRPLPSRRGELRGGVRLDLLQTLRAAAPKQVLRWRASGDAPAGRIAIRKEDFHIRRYREHKPSTTIFVVDASGSAAIERLAEAKGAVELLLGDCYIRRDEVALIAFRGAGAEIVLPPTRSLHRAKRGLQALPGGGGTPLAAGLIAAGQLADEVRRKGRTPTLVILTDGRANVTRAGLGGREQAQAEAGLAAASLRARQLKTVLVDASIRPEPRAGQLAATMGALYLPLPRADARRLSAAVRATAGLQEA
jgi:magnesium chelatase subunit D